jgi:chromosome segregation ATPase
MSRAYVSELEERWFNARARITKLEVDYARAEKVAVSLHAITKKAMDRIAELEAANAICRTDIEALMTSCDKLETRNAELEAERDRLAGELAEARAALSNPLGE